MNILYEFLINPNNINLIQIINYVAIDIEICFVLKIYRNNLIKLFNQINIIKEFNINILK